MQQYDIKRGLLTWLLLRQFKSLFLRLLGLSIGRKYSPKQNFPHRQPWTFPSTWRNVSCCNPGSSSIVSTLKSQPTHFCQSSSSTQKKFSLASTHSMSTLTKFFQGSPSPLRNFPPYQDSDQISSTVKAKVKMVTFCLESKISQFK